VKNKLIALCAGLLLSFSVASHAAKTEDPFEFKRPVPKVSDQMYKEAVKEYNDGNVNAKLFLDGMRKGWKANEAREGLDEPEDIFMGCVLFQVGGMKALNEINFDHTARVLAGGPKEDGTGNYGETDAKNLVQSWNEDQKATAVRLYVFMEEYGEDCYRLVHQGFTAGIPKLPVNEVKN